MGRPVKPNLKKEDLFVFYNFFVNLFQEEDYNEVKLYLTNKFDFIGRDIFLKILEKIISSNGYWCKWKSCYDQEYIDLFYQDSLVKLFELWKQKTRSDKRLDDLIQDVVEEVVNIGILDKELFTQGILTSYEVQVAYKNTYIYKRHKAPLVNDYKIDKSKSLVKTKLLDNTGSISLSFNLDRSKDNTSQNNQYIGQELVINRAETNNLSGRNYEYIGQEPRINRAETQICVTDLKEEEKEIEKEEEERKRKSYNKKKKREGEEKDKEKGEESIYPYNPLFEENSENSVEESKCSLQDQEQDYLLGLPDDWTNCSGVDPIYEKVISAWNETNPEAPFNSMNLTAIEMMNIDQSLKAHNNDIEEIKNAFRQASTTPLWPGTPREAPWAFSWAIKPKNIDSLLSAYNHARKKNEQVINVSTIFRNASDEEFKRRYGVSREDMFKNPNF